MTARILDGRALAATLRSEVAEQAAVFRKQFGFGPVLAVVRVGNDAPSVSYARQIDQSFREAGFGYQLEVLAEDASEEDLARVLGALGKDRLVHGVMLQRPLPARMNADAIFARLPPAKDVEGVTPLNLGRLFVHSGDFFPTSTPSAAIVLLKRSNLPIAGQHAVIVGRSVILGRPLAQMLLYENATVTTCHSRTPDVAAYTRQADILVAAAGKPGLIRGDMIKPGAVVIDFGVNFVKGKMVGDVDFESARQVAGAITPVPGGTGPITSVMLMANTLKAARELI